jgi:four helix bundle protein
LIVGLHDFLGARRRWHSDCFHVLRMGEQAEFLKKRTMRFALDVCKLLKQLPWDEPGPTIKRQLARSSTGTAFNYRAACRGRSHDEFTAKIGIVAEEADESQGWLEFIQEARLIASKELERLYQEATELSAIFSASVGTARSKRRHKGNGLPSGNELPKPKQSDNPQ